MVGIDQVRPRRREVDDSGLEHVVLGEDDVDGRDQDRAATPVASF
jgi:hypothetical protein